MAQAPVSRAQAQEALNAVAENKNNQARAAEALKLCRSTLQNRLRAAKMMGLVPTSKPVTEADELRFRNIELEDTVRTLRTELQSIQRDNLSVEQVRSAIFGLSNAVPSIPNWTAQPNLGPSDAGIPCTIWSDWHWGEVVDPKQVAGFNRFNLDTAHARIKRLVEKTIFLCETCLHHDEPYPGIVVALAGDMCSGDIHDELVETNELPLMPALLDLFGVLIWALTALADTFGNVFVPCVIGNHARNTEKPRAKNRAYSNFDWLLYQFLEKHFRSNADQRVRFHISNDSDVVYSVYNHRYLLTHGDSLGVRGGDGIIGAIGPMMRGNVKTQGMADGLGTPYDTLLMGHWHRHVMLGGLIANGSLKGYDEYAHTRRFRPELPEQTLWFTHPRAGIVWPSRIYLEKPKEESTERAWVSWPTQTTD